MESLNKWLVGLDLTDLDQSIIKYTKLLSDILRPQHIEFVHIAHRLSDSVHLHLPDSLTLPPHDELKSAVEKKLFNVFSDADPVSCEILDGTVKFDLWRESYIKDIDLFIAGSKPKHKGRGLIPKKFVRKSFCSVLFIPEEAPDNINKIWVPIDFSEPSGEALNQALQMSQKVKPRAHVYAHHVYQLPHGYFYKGFPRNEIIRAIKQESENQYVEFVKQFNPQMLPLISCFTELFQSYAANSIKQEAEHQSADLIVMAAGGKSRLSRFFLGSETEELLQTEMQVPLMILKKKADHVRLWDLVNP
jgi:nucleotide-binding universal stress UspA family protein